MSLPSQAKLDSAMLTKGEAFSRNRVQQLERRVQEMAIHEDIVQAELERLREQAQLVPQLQALTEQLKRDNANLCADLESAQRFLKQHDRRRDNVAGQRDEFAMRTRRLEEENEMLRHRLSIADADLRTANERSDALRQNLSDALQRGAELERGGGSKSLAQDTGIFGEALLERLEEQESELVKVKAAAARTTTRYVLHEAAGPWEVATLDEIQVLARPGNDGSGHVGKLKGKGRSSVFSSRRAAEAQGQLGKLTMDYKRLREEHSAMEESHNSMIEEVEMLRRELENKTKRLRDARMQRNFKLAAQKASLTKQRLTRNLYMSRGMIDMSAPSANVMTGRVAPRHGKDGGGDGHRGPDYRVSTGMSGLRISTGSAFSTTSLDQMPSLSSNSLVMKETRRDAKKRSMKVSLPKGGQFLLDETPSPRESSLNVEPRPMALGV